MSAIKPNQHNKVKGQDTAESKSSSKRSQGEAAKTGNKGRSLGSEYAIAVERVLQTRRQKNEEFLGVKKKTIDVTGKNSDKVLYRGKNGKKAK